MLPEVQPSEISSEKQPYLLIPNRPDLVIFTDPEWITTTRNLEREYQKDPLIFKIGVAEWALDYSKCVIDFNFYEENNYQASNIRPTATRYAKIWIARRLELLTYEDILRSVLPKKDQKSLDTKVRIRNVRDKLVGTEPFGNDTEILKVFNHATIFPFQTIQSYLQVHSEADFNVDEWVEFNRGMRAEQEKMIARVNEYLAKVESTLLYLQDPQKRDMIDVFFDIRYTQMMKAREQRKAKNKDLLDKDKENRKYFIQKMTEKIRTQLKKDGNDA